MEVENNMTSVERMVEYINLPQEPPRCVCRHDKHADSILVALHALLGG